MLVVNSLILPKAEKSSLSSRKIRYVERHSEQLSFIFSNDTGIKIKMTGKIYKESFGDMALKSALNELALIIDGEDVKKRNRMIIYK